MGVGAGCTVHYLGNFSVPYATESHVSASLEYIGCTVNRIQEGSVKAVEVVPWIKERMAGHRDVFLHTQTFGLAVSGGTRDERLAMLNGIKSLDIPTVGYHLDLWHGLDRADQLATEPFFSVDHLFSTDGGHDDDWKELGINHHWLPPAVYHAEAYDGTPQRHFTSDVAFVGSWRAYAHEEHWPVRQSMLQTLRARYGSRKFRCWPQGKAIRGRELNDLYASVKVVVGDSCLAGKISGYWSDRIPESTGRGGFLIHPYVPGLLNVHPSLVTYEAGNWNELIEKVDHFLAHDSDRELNRKENAELTRLHHTYAKRMEAVLKIIGVIDA